MNDTSLLQRPVVYNGSDSIQLIAPLTQSCKARLLADILVPARLKRERTVNKLAEERVSACTFASYWPNKTRSFGAVFFLQKTQGTWSAISSMWSYVNERPAS